MNASERWLPVVGWETLYEVSSAGSIRSLDRIDGNGCRRPGRVLKQQVDPRYGYRVVQLHVGGRRRAYTMGPLVLFAFAGPRPAGHECCHNNGDPSDNRLENLRWDTSSANKFDSIAHGTHPTASKTHCSAGHELVVICHSGKQAGVRGCRICKNTMRNILRARKRAEMAAA